MTQIYEQYNANSYLFGTNAKYLEILYEAYLNNSISVPDDWRAYFNTIKDSPTVGDNINKSEDTQVPVTTCFPKLVAATTMQKKKSASIITVSPDIDIVSQYIGVTQLIINYRNLGSRYANLDPLQRQEHPNIKELELSFYSLTNLDMDILFNIHYTYFDKKIKSLRDLLSALKETYCRSIGAEFSYISNQIEVQWIEKRLESTRALPLFSNEKKKHILERLTAAEGLERYLHTKYVGQKRFSLEGGESFITSLDETIQRARKHGIQEIVIGMAHRGRLNVLVNILGKTPQELFLEFEGHHADDLPAGDVKYHQGFSSDINTKFGSVHLSLAFNPSHLEIVNPVVEGSVKARMERRNDKNGSQVLPILVHGDAAFSGQGVVMETLNLSQTRGYGTGGTLHIIINNQIGFTTSDPRDSRSTLYCSDVVKMIEAPVLHVNGDDPEAVVFATQIAIDYRMQFKKDIIIDIVCFRKLGHNEQDTSALTQPLMYKKIAKHPGTRKLYANKLVMQGIISDSECNEIITAYRSAMDAGKHTIDPVITNAKNKYTVDWLPFLNSKWTDTANTAVPLDKLQYLSSRITTIPKNFKPHSLVEKVINDRAAMGRGELKVDWGMGEHLAYSSLIISGYAVRLTGQDVGRGTFVHRHAVLHDQNRERWNEGIYIPLQNIAENQSQFTIIDSVLSEEAVLGFEYGFSTAEPNTLTIWEAQFGDFANGAQVVIDQFISSGEVKWGRASGLVLMLPHGYEGQGPEHSSARLERYLQLCADNNMQVVQPTTAAQIFHVLRRQMIRIFRKPLIIMTPKSLLRNKAASSMLSEFATGAFQTVISEQDNNIKAYEVKRIIGCSGKIYYDLINARNKRGQFNIAIIRLEQLYPFPHIAFSTILKNFPNFQEFVWTQDEPQNQGTWLQIQYNIFENLMHGQKLAYAGRPASASPAVGYYDKHYAQQKTLIDTAFSDLKSTILIK